MSAISRLPNVLFQDAPESAGLLKQLKRLFSRNDAAEAASALRAEHVDSSRIGKLKRLLAQGAATRPGVGLLAGLGGAGAGAAAAMGMQSQPEQNAELERILQMQGGMY